MTRTFQFTLNDTSWHTIWSLISSQAGFDPFGANSPFTPSMVSVFEIQSPSPANAGMNLYYADLPLPASTTAGINIVSGGSDTLQSSRNSIDLKTKIVSTDTKGALVNVTVV